MVKVESSKHLHLTCNLFHVTKSASFVTRGLRSPSAFEVIED